MVRVRVKGLGSGSVVSGQWSGLALLLDGEVEVVAKVRIELFLHEHGGLHQLLG